MSADAWGECPKCRQTKQTKAPVGNPQFRLDETIRMDYEQSITEDGLYYCYFSALCSVCGWKFSRNREEKVVI